MQLPQNSWGELLAPETDKLYYKHLMNFIITEYQEHTIYPPQEYIFQALELTDFSEVKVVILGQDPYHGAGQAHGLAFSVPVGVKPPPSLRNMLKELESDLGITNNGYGNLVKWAKQGVLLLNTVLTVRAGEANSHQNKGWEQFTDQIITLLSQQDKPIIFVLWGKPAQTKKRLIDKHHPIIESVHPSPLSAFRGFFGSKPYSQINTLLLKQQQEPIDWSL